VLERPPDVEKLPKEKDRKPEEKKQSLTELVGRTFEVLTKQRDEANERVKQLEKQLTESSKPKELQ
jgi:hypothetical protein